MTEELYINGQPMDLPVGTLISLEWVSNVLAGTIMVEASHSYTVRLPATENNRRILGDPANVVLTTSPQRLSFLEARYYRNEIDILGPCRAALLSYANSIEIALYWGGWPAYSEWAAKDRTLNDVGGVTSASITMGTTATRYQTFKTIGYGLVNYSYETESGVVVPNAVRPAILVTKMLQLIEMDLSAQTGEQANIRIDRAGIDADDIMTFGTSAPSENGAQRFTGTAGCVFVSSSGNRIASAVYTDPAALHDGYNWRVINTRMRVRVSGSMAMPTDSYFTGADLNYAQVIGVDAEGATQVLTQSEIAYSPLSRQITINMDETIETKDLASVYITLPTLAGATGMATTGPFATIQIDPLNDYATTNDTIPLAGNLGPMKATEFLQGVCDYYGLVCIPDEATATLNLISWNNLLENGLENATDLTDKLVGNGIEGIIRNARADLGNFAQHNLLQWTKDSTQDEDSATWYRRDGDLQIQNVLLEQSRVMATLPWAPSNGDRMTPLSEETKMKQRIGHLVSPQDTSPLIYPAYFVYATSNELPYRTLWKYRALKTMLENPYELSVFVRLSELDLKTFQKDTPVYFGQFGRYYIVTSIKTDNSTDLSQVTMFQI